ncbi:coenzyme F420-reducing hydrogenase, FrhD protein [Methanofollis formosanus]|uniref:Coenzyme F420-reducing hydrogenase, FrhD protein n=1 Tax=Methanofollis formosanus TaxID=299308 RepID=A0A8G1A1H3_9EURY|nr:coenzyme F420-reducing hydrogenase, FrhD protein [Methanofollis formosanus]QYZ79447.1 coenzyme F420-reducing hydrogenase, FrhD protein [Methanofollis formosanus]
MLFREIVVVGCGNPLFADDGFGPAVVEELQKFDLPEKVKVIDGGLGGPHYLFTLMAHSDEPVKKLIVVDIADFGGEPGTLVHLTPEDLPPGSYRDVHSWNMVEPLQLLKDRVKITIVGCQPKRVTEPNVELGLSDEVEKAIPKAVRYVLKEIGVDDGATIKVKADLWEEGTAQTRGDPESSVRTGNTEGSA